MLEKDFAREFYDVMYPPATRHRQHKKFSKKKATNPELCKKCGGRCCKNCGCQFSPDDFREMSFDYLYEEISKGYITFGEICKEEWSGGEEVIYLRIRNVNESTLDGLTAKPGCGPCAMLTKNGCKFSFEERPTGGRNMIPSMDKNSRLSCVQVYDTEDCAKEWSGYKSLLMMLIDEFEEKSA